MSDLDEYENEIRALMDEIDRGIKEISKSSKKQQFDVRAKAEMLEGRLKRANAVLKSFRADYRELEKKDQGPYATKATEFEETLKTLKNELEWACKQNENGGLGAAGSHVTPQDDYQQTMIQAKRIQQEDIDATARMAGQVVTINQVGQATLEEMAIQEEKMKNIDKNFNEIDGNLKLAQRQMRAFARKMATDKLIMGLVLLIVLSIIFVIVWKIVKK